MFDSELMEKATLLVRKDFTAEKKSATTCLSNRGNVGADKRGF